MGTKIALLLTAALLAVAVACGGGEQESAYVQENERLLDALPTMPGTKRLETASSPYYRDQAPEEEPLGYTTSAPYQAPSEMTPRDVIEFYTLALRDNWSYRARQVPVNTGGDQVARVLRAEFTQGAASVSINTDGMSAGGQNTFEVVVDYGGDR